MTAVGVAIIAAALGCYALKLAGVSLPDAVLAHPRVTRVAALLPVAMLTALVVTDLFDSNGRYSGDWPAVAGVAAAAGALRLRCSLVVVFLTAVATAAATRALT